MPLGGIGTGNVALGGRGDLRSWEIMNRPARAFTPSLAFFAVRTESADGTIVTRVAEGPIDIEDYEGWSGSPVGVAGLPRMRQARFNAAYPLGTISLEDADLPVTVQIESFNPLVPTDADASGLPAAVMRFVCSNRSSERVEVSLCGTVDNITGAGGITAREAGRHPNFATSATVDRSSRRAAGVEHHCPGWPADADTWGSLALGLLDPVSPTVRTRWADLSWGGHLLDFWTDLHDDGDVTEPDPEVASIPVASVADRRTLEPGATTSFTFVLAWHFPNRRAWGRQANGPLATDADDVLIGNHYCHQYPNAWSVVEHFANELPELERRTVKFVEAVLDSGLPPVISEAALFNLSTLRTQTCFRTPDGRLFGWEGIGDTAGSCWGSCTHVWNYEYATPFLFGALARGMRDTEFAHATDPDGLMSFRIGLPLADRARALGIAAADGQLGALVKLYREWRLSGDDAFLSRMWPMARSAMEFCWLPGGWDADRDGVMEGAQHNTMDVEYYGPNPQMAGWYLAALEATEQMARHVGEQAFADQCADLAARGRKWVDANLFNGRYYQQIIQLPTVPPRVGLGHDRLDIETGQEPDLQLGDGCLVDQLVGQLAAHLAGLGYVLDPDHVRTTLETISELNRMDDLHAHVNGLRSFALADESALVMAAYPDPATRPTRPFPYYAEVMTGFEYTAAIGLACEEKFEAAERIVAAIRRRYDGQRRNPFDEAECGHHYVRAMASWGAVPAWTGFKYDAQSGRMRLKARASGPVFWSTGDAWGTCKLTGSGAEIAVHEGQLRLKLLVTGDRSLRPLAGELIGAGQTAQLQ